MARWHRHPQPTRIRPLRRLNTTPAQLRSHQPVEGLRPNCVWWLMPRSTLRNVHAERAHQRPRCNWYLAIVSRVPDRNSCLRRHRIGCERPVPGHPPDVVHMAGRASTGGCQRRCQHGAGEASGDSHEQANTQRKARMWWVHRRPRADNGNLAYSLWVNVRRRQRVGPTSRPPDDTEVGL